MRRLRRNECRQTLGAEISLLQDDIERAKLLSGTILAKQVRQEKSSVSLAEVEFSVFSQFGDDGIIQYLVSHIDIQDRSFIEFGVETYREANTRFLLLHDNWRGLIMEGNRAAVDEIWKSDRNRSAGYA